MRVLVVGSGNSGQLSPFVLEQIESVGKLGVIFETFIITGKGIKGYLSNVRPLAKKIETFKPDIIHSHYGLSGLLSLFVKGNHILITTFHGNDINSLQPFSRFKPNYNRFLSWLVYSFGNHSVFVTNKLAHRLNANDTKSDIIPCQINLDTFFPLEMDIARREMNMSPLKRYVLFSSSFSTYIKNYPLAEKSCKLVGELELIELKGYTRREVNLLLNACNLALVTSFNEGSNQFLKEAMACNRPIVSTRVGDTEWLIGNTAGCYYTSYDITDVAEKIKKALDFGHNHIHTSGRARIIELGLDSETIAEKVYGVYKKVNCETY
jgi:teichuronic acid biosynthesis glycosyltransferase TuaC